VVDKGAQRPVPRGWPTEVSPPGSDDWEAIAAAWLLDAACSRSSSTPASA